MSRPSWLPKHVPELDGLRGMAILPVVLYHCHGKLVFPWIESAAQWGWAGVNLFFILSGFLITGIIVDGRSDRRFFVNFYARRALRIWPVYVLLLALSYFIIPILFRVVLAFNFSEWPAVWEAIRTAPWWCYVLFVQNIFAVAMPGTVSPTWSLAVEEQFYIVWAPVGHFLNNYVLMGLALAELVLSPFLRAHPPLWITPTHTLIHLDGLAVGALVALSIRSFKLPQSFWRWLGRSLLLGAGTGAFFLLRHGSALSDTLLALCFGGALLTALSCSGAGTPLARFFRLAPLRFYGRISYGLYMTHITAFVVIGALDEAMQPYGWQGQLIVLCTRLTLATLLAVILWECFEKKILTLKKRFEARTA
jgi:peptidoglycan/LPS O-acetylase OafA/YrhL